MASMNYGVGSLSYGRVRGGYCHCSQKWYSYDLTPNASCVFRATKYIVWGKLSGEELRDMIWKKYDDLTATSLGMMVSRDSYTNIALLHVSELF